MSTWFASIGYLCFFANILAKEMLTAKLTIAMMKASGTISAAVDNEGTVTGGNLLGKEKHVKVN